LDDRVHFYSADERHEALRHWAYGDHHTEAGVELLITHGVWPERLDAAGFLTVTRGRLKPGRTIGDLARPDLLGALADLESKGGRLRSRSSEHRILALAASLTDGHEVSLTWALDLLTAEESSAVLAVFARALPYAYR
jgi:hypothetical protein